MSNIIAEARTITQTRYGHYCNKARQNNLIPMDFESFKAQQVSTINQLLKDLKKLKSNNNSIICSNDMNNHPINS